MQARALETRFINLSMAAAAAGLVIELVQNGPPIRIVAISGGMGSDSTVPGFEVSWSSATAGTITTININIRDVSGGGFSNVPWTLRAKASAPGTWTFEPDPAAFLSRVMCDPIASMSSSVAGQVPEKTAVTLTASSATIGTVLGGPFPIVSYRFASIGPTAVSPLPVCSASPFVTFNTPGVYAASPVDLVLQVAFSDCAGASTAWLTNTSTTISLTIQPRPQQVAILLDRSGSMSGDRWTNAVASARAIVRLFSTFRGGVHPGDRIGLLAFEDTGCSMGAGSVPSTPTLLPLNDPAAADAAICGVGLGNPGSCTPIGQGLVAAMDLLAGGGQAADTRYTIVLLTDGYENAGPVQVGPGILPPGVVSFATARTATPGRSFVNQRLALFTVGLGSTVDEPVLNNLPAGAAGGGCISRSRIRGTWVPRSVR